MLNNMTTEPHSKLICSNITKLLVSIGDQFKSYSENVATNMGTFQIKDDFKELSLIIPENNVQEVFGAEIEKFEGTWATQTCVTQWLDSIYHLPRCRRNV